MDYRAKDSNLCGPADQEIGAENEPWLKCDHDWSSECLQNLPKLCIDQNFLNPTIAYKQLAMRRNHGLHVIIGLLSVYKTCQNHASINFALS